MAETGKTPRKPRSSAADQGQDQGDLLGTGRESTAGTQAVPRARSGRLQGPLDNFFSEIRKGSEDKAYVRIKRIVDHDRAYLVQGGRILWREYPGPEFIEKTWGGGNYVVEYYSGGTEPIDRLPRATEKVDIEGPAREQTALAASPTVPAAPAQPYAPDQLAGQVAHAIAQSMAPVLTAMAAALERLHHAPAAAPAPPLSLLDLTQAMKNMQSLIPQPAAPAPAAPPVDQFGQFREILQLAKEFTSPESGESNPLGFLEKAIDKLGTPIIEHLQSERERSQQLPVATQPGAVRPMPKNQLQQDLDQLLGFCDKGEPVENVISIAINMIPEHLLPYLLNEPDPLSLLARYEPRATQEPYRSWLTDLVAAMRDELADNLGGDAA